MRGHARGRAQETLSQAEVARFLGTEERRVKRLVFEARQALLDRREATTALCRDIQEELANARGSQLRRRKLAMHVDQCDDCAAYLRELLEQRNRLRLVLPAIPLKAASFAGSWWQGPGSCFAARCARDGPRGWGGRGPCAFGSE